MRITITPSLVSECKVTEIINVDLGRRVSFVFGGDDIEVMDEYHSMHDLYRHRMALNIALFHAWYRDDYGTVTVMKSKQHHPDSDPMFEGYFIVMAVSEYGQISYHYKLKHWDKFNIPEVEYTPEWDGHNSQDVMERLTKL